MTKFDEVGTDEDIHFFLFQSTVWGLDVLHSLYQVLHLLKIYFVLHEYLELLSYQYSHTLPLFIVAQIDLLVIFLCFREVIYNCSHFLSDSTLSELITKLFKFALVLLLLLGIQLFWCNQCLQQILIYVLIRLHAFEIRCLRMLTGRLPVKPKRRCVLYRS